MDKVSQQVTEAEAHWPIYVLTLSGDEERRASLLTALDQSELPYRLFLGVDGRNGLPKLWAGHIDREAAQANLGRAMTDGEFACALSHLEIYREISERGLPGAIVLEDDAVLGAQFGKFWQLGLYRNAEIIMLDHSHARVRGHGMTVMPGIVARRLSLPSCLTTAYSISANAAAALLDAGSPISNTADWPGDIVIQGAWALDPRIVDHQDPSSGVSHIRVERDKAPQRRGSLSRAVRRWSSLKHWHVWMIKRLSVRIS